MNRGPHISAWARLRRRTPLGLLQLTHNRTRLLVALAGIAFADLLMFMELGVMSNFYEVTVQTHRALNTDVVLISPLARDIMNSGTIPRVRLYQAAGYPEVAAAEPVDISFIDWRNPSTGVKGTMTLLAASPDGHAFLTPAIADLQYRLKQPDSALFDRGSRSDNTEVLRELDAGHSVNFEVNRRTMTLVGAYKAGATFGSDGTFVVSLDTFQHLFPDRSSGSITLGLLRLRPGVDPTEFARALNTRLPEDTRAMTKDQFIQFAKDWQTKTAPIAFIFIAGTVVSFFIGTAMVYQVLSTDVNDHMAEYATFKAMGYTNRYLSGVIVEESLILAGTGFVPGFFAGVALYAVLALATALPIHMTTPRATGVFFLTLAMCVISGFLAARKVRSADPAEVFA